jgi:hypothetical protein
LVLAPLAVVAGISLALVAGSAPAASPKRPARLTVGVEVLGFHTAGSTTTARGLVTALLTDNQGRTTRVRTTVALTASAGGGCKVLHLFLNELTLSLLGLHAHLDKVTLDITGNAQGGVLGSLFCKLAKAKVASARASYAHALTAAVRREGRVVSFNANLTPKATASAANPTCSVLDLVVGPLNLQLLGLVVDLQKVHLTVTATRGQGKLGDLFCQLADNSGTTTTGTTTT